MGLPETPASPEDHPADRQAQTGKNNRSNDIAVGFAKDHIKLFNSDCITAMKQLPDNSIDSIVTDPPYGLSFMGKHWDYDVPGRDSA